MNVSEFFARHPSLRARLARVFLLCGVAIAVVYLLPSVPREQILLFRWEGVGVVKELEATWTAAGRSEPSGGVTLHLPSPSRTVRHRFSAPNGPYVLDISVEQLDEEAAPTVTPNDDSVAAEAPPKVGSDVRREPLHRTFVRRVNFEGGETVIRL